MSKNALHPETNSHAAPSCTESDIEIPMNHSCQQSPGKPMMLIKEDWEDIKTRCTHWWANELYDRALVFVKAPKQGSISKGLPYSGAMTLETSWIDVEYLIWRKENEIRTTYYGGELTPFLFFNSPVVGPLFMGCEPKFTAETLWADPLPVGADGYPPIRFHRESRYWRLISEGTLRMAQASRGSWYIHPSIDYTGDTLAGIRGVNNLMIDIFESTDWVRQAVKQLSGILIGISDELWKLIDEKITGLEGSLAGCGVWSPGRGAAIACDMAANLSPKQFEDLFLTSLIEYMRTVDYRCFHMDGYVQHLDLLLSVPELQAIQWYPPDIYEPNGKGILPWIPLIKRIQKAGKAVQVYCKPDEIPALLGEVSARGLCIGTTRDSASEQEARDLVDLVAKLSRDR